jgi:hypothetical protein
MKVSKVMLRADRLQHRGEDLDAVPQRRHLVPIEDRRAEQLTQRPLELRIRNAITLGDPVFDLLLAGNEIADEHRDRRGGSRRHGNGEEPFSGGLHGGTIRASSPHCGPLRGEIRESSTVHPAWWISKPGVSTLHAICRANLAARCGLHDPPTEEVPR